MTRVIEIRRSAGEFYSPHLLRLMDEASRYLRGENVEPHWEIPLPYPDGSAVDCEQELRSGSSESAIDLARRAFANPESWLHQPDPLGEFPRIFEVDAETGERREIFLDQLTASE